ncbi:LANO_0F10836g1_1 [Lachancea nothofagi CBS 11611]|uniref:LANO_0F10836g1_1 n=1 Tax=Lachancea nothofagi CBS 11611 TaxID=1266666 RepID=A0A1G4KAL8_9SACH|nr:LANO_0F10836g1_1 [Lachancea nothofagi CBS 11611]
MATRNVSASSTTSLESTGNFIAFKEEPNNSLDISLDQVLKYAIKVILLEYINEPRFRQTDVRTKGPATNSRPQARTREVTEQKRAKRRSWLFSDDSGKKSESSEGKQLHKLVPVLENYLKMVAVDKIKVKEASFRRSLLKFYNDSFLDPKASKQLSSTNRPEELIMLFTKAAQGEITKVYQEANGKQELYRQICSFIDMITRLVIGYDSPASKLALRLNEYKGSFSRSGDSTTALSPVSSLSSGLISTEPSIKPTFKITDIKHSEYLMELFDISEIDFQQTLIKHVSDTNNNGFSQSLQVLKKRVVQQTNSDPSLSFSKSDNFESWLKQETKELDVLIAKFSAGVPKSSNSSSKNFNELANYIPENPRDVYIQLTRLIFSKEFCATSNKLVLSQEAWFFLNKCAAYWRVNSPCSKATMLYAAANAGPLGGDCLNTQAFEDLFSLISTKIFNSEELFRDRSSWHIIDQKEWSKNLTFSLEQTLNLTQQLLSELHQKPRPKFSPVLNVYYGFILPDLEASNHELTKSDLYRRHIKRLRRVLFRASEQFYVSLVNELPRDKALDIHDIKCVADRILSEIQTIQKKYTKPLLGELNIAVECAKILVEAFGVDCSAMLAQVEKGGKIPFYDGAETYKSLRELRDVYLQVQPAKKYPFNLEKYFLKYLSELCDEACASTIKVISTAIKKETWDPIDTSESYSTSVIDIFKMINESIDLFVKLEWGSQYQIHKIYTFLLKSVADGLSFYANTITDIIKTDINTTLEESETFEDNEELPKGFNVISQTATAKMKTSWIYTEMKNALKSNHVSIPKPFEFQSRTCTCLNNLNQMMQLINNLEERINPDEISKSVHAHEQVDMKRKSMTEKQNRGLRHLYSIKIVRAENLSSSAHEANALTAISIVDTKLKREVAKTREVLKSGRPVWNEEFEFDVAINDQRLISFILWNHKEKFNSASSKVCGRAFLCLDSNKFRDDGYPEQVCLNLDTRGKIIVQIAVETERLDALFSMGRAFRSLNRARDRSIELMVSKFQVFVHFSFSRTTLKTVCGPTGLVKATNSVVYDSLVPLFDYLNANLSILASHLSRDLLLKIMLEAWEEILSRADDLLLPFLSDAEGLQYRNSKAKSIWENAVDAAKHGINSPSSSDRHLTQVEIDTIFEWLGALCVDFFHNNGEGPAMSELKNAHYQALLLIPVYYDRSPLQLKKELEGLNQEYRKLLFEANDIEVRDQKHARYLGKRAKSVARRKTVLANASRKRRVELDKEIRAAENNPLETNIATQDILLRILIAKGEADYVMGSLEFRDSLTKALFTEKIVKAARSSHH